MDELPIEEYDKIAEHMNELYSYSVVAYLEAYNMEKDKNPKYEDAVINNLTVSYDGEEYVFDIGQITMSKAPKALGDWFDNKYLSQKSTGYWMQTLHYSTDNEFELTANRIFESYDKPVKIVNTELINGSTYDISHMEVIMTNDSGSTESVWRPGDELIIPANTEVSLSVIGTSENIRNNVAFKVAPVIKLEVEANDKICEIYYETTGSVYDFTKYEIYAYLVDGIDIFSSYYDVKSEATQW